MIPIRFGFFLSGLLAAVTLLGWVGLPAKFVLAPLVAAISWNLGVWIADWTIEAWRNRHDG